MGETAQAQLTDLCPDPLGKHQAAFEGTDVPFSFILWHLT
jgi:hypothetical protein